METKDKVGVSAQDNPQKVKYQRESILKYVATFDEYVLWYASPLSVRMDMGIKTQAEFAAKHGLDPKTLWYWRKRPEFMPRMKEILNEWARGKTPDVVNAILKGSIKGNPFSQKLWMQIFEGFTEKTELDVTTQTTFSINDIRYVIEALPEQLKQKHYANLRELLDDSAAHANARNIDLEVIRAADESALSSSDSGSEDTVRDATYHDAQDVSLVGTNDVAYSDPFCVCHDMVRPTFAYHHQSTARWWKKQVARDCGI